MDGYKLHKDVGFSPKVINFYYDDKSKNRRFSRSVLKVMGIYTVKDEKIVFKPVMILGMIIFWLLGLLQLGMGFYFYNPDVKDIVNAIPSFSLILSGLNYTFFMLIITYQGMIIWWNRKRFEDFKGKPITQDAI
jgi:hypothetical protein